jgi:hypothetical protein
MDGRDLLFSYTFTLNNKRRHQINICGNTWKGRGNVLLKKV